MKPLSLATLAATAALALTAAPAHAEITRSVFPYPGSDITLVNHRGLSPGFPENTLAAFRNSIAMGVDAIEIDMRATEDGEIVIMHDDAVDRTTDGTGAVASLTLAEIKALDAGGGEHVPTFEETLELTKDTGVKLLLDIKTAAVTGRAVDLAEQHDMIDEVIVGPRTVANLQEFKALNPELTTLGFIATTADADAMIAAGVDYIRLWPEWILASRDSADCRADYAARVAAFERGERDHPGSASCLVQQVADTGTPVWSTVNDLPYAGMDELIRLGATGILSDLPAELDRLIADIDAKRVSAATGQLRDLAGTLAQGYSARSLLARQAALLRELLRHPWRAREIGERLRELHREYAAAAHAQAQLARAKAQLRAGTDACATLGTVAERLDGDYAWAAREARRTLAC